MLALGLGYGQIFCGPQWLADVIYDISHASPAATPTATPAAYVVRLNVHRGSLSAVNGDGREPLFLVDDHTLPLTATHLLLYNFAAIVMAYPDTKLATHMA